VLVELVVVLEKLVGVVDPEEDSEFAGVVDYEIGGGVVLVPVAR
jgi:hypothetical protein